MSRTTPDLFLRNAQVAGSVYQLAEAAGAAANGATIARWAAASGQPNRRFVPLQTSQENAAPPAIGAAPQNKGWRQATSWSPSDAFTIEAGNWDVRLDVRRSGQALEVDINSRWTVIVYEVTSAGAFVKEIGRASATFTVTTALTERTFTFDPGATQIGAGNKVQVEVYVTALSAIGADLAPATATDLVVEVNTNAASSRFEAVPNHFRRYDAAVADGAAASDAPSRALVAARSVADAAPAVDEVSRVAHFPRAVSENAPASDVVARTAHFPRAAAESAPASDAPSRALVSARPTSESAPASDVASRTVVASRSVADNAPALDSVARRLSAGRAVADVATASDEPSRSGVFSRALAESAPAADAVGRVINYGRFVEDNIGPGDCPPPPPPEPAPGVGGGSIGEAGVEAVTGGGTAESTPGAREAYAVVGAAAGEANPTDGAGAEAATTGTAMVEAS